MLGCSPAEAMGGIPWSVRITDRVINSEVQPTLVVFLISLPPLRQELADEVGAQAGSEQLQEFFYRQAGMADQRTKGANREFPVLRDREVHPEAGFCHHQVAPHLSQPAPASLLKCLGASLPEILRSRLMGLHSDYNRLLSLLFR